MLKRSKLKLYLYFFRDDFDSSDKEIGGQAQNHSLYDLSLMGCVLANTWCLYTFLLC